MFPDRTVPSIFRTVSAEPLRTSVSALLAAMRVVRACAGLLALLALAAVWLLFPECSRRRRQLEKLGWHLFMQGFGVRIRVSGQAEPGAMLIANHVSWIDIAALARSCDASFVAKQEVARWPIIGLLARKHGCVFIDRSRRGAVPEDAARMRARLAVGRSLVIFAEGTTSAGWDVLPFRSSLFAASIEGGCNVIQPVAISYRNRDGSWQTPEQRRAVAWLGEDALLPHAMKLAARGGAMVDIWFGPALPSGHRKELAVTARAAIQRRLADAVRLPD